jgi:hypothetical protein
MYLMCNAVAVEQTGGETDCESRAAGIPPSSPLHREPHMIMNREKPASTAQHAEVEAFPCRSE